MQYQIPPLELGLTVTLSLISFSYNSLDSYLLVCQLKIIAEKEIWDTCISQLKMIGQNDFYMIDYNHSHKYTEQITTQQLYVLYTLSTYAVSH